MLLQATSNSDASRLESGEPVAALAASRDEPRPARTGIKVLHLPAPVALEAERLPDPTMAAGPQPAGARSPEPAPLFEPEETEAQPEPSPGLLAEAAVAEAAPAPDEGLEIPESNIVLAQASYGDTVPAPPLTASPSLLSETAVNETAAALEEGAEIRETGTSLPLAEVTGTLESPARVETSPGPLGEAPVDRTEAAPAAAERALSDTGPELTAEHPSLPAEQTDKQESLEQIEVTQPQETDPYEGGGEPDQEPDAEAGASLSTVPLPTPRPEIAVTAPPTAPKPAPAVARHEPKEPDAKPRSNWKPMALAPADQPARRAPKAAPSRASTGAYGMRVWSALARHKPRVGQRGSTTVTFAIGAGGALRFVRVARSSGNTRLDQMALATVRNAAPFPAPPGVTTGAAPFTVRIDFP